MNEAKRWEVEVRDLSSSKVVRTAQVRAARWMDAIRQVRETSGHKPDLPESASFRFGAHGSVAVTVASESLCFTVSSRDGMGQEAWERRPRRKTAVYAEAPAGSLERHGASRENRGGPVTAAWAQPSEIAGVPSNIVQALKDQNDTPADRTIPSKQAHPGTIEFESERLRLAASSAAPTGWRLMVAEVVDGDVTTPLRLHRLIWHVGTTVGLPRICSQLVELRAAVATQVNTSYPAMLELGVTTTDPPPNEPLIALRWKSWKPCDEWLVAGHDTALVDSP